MLNDPLAFGLPLISPLLANCNCSCGQPNDELYLERCTSSTARRNEIRDEFKSCFNFFHIYNIKEERIDSERHRVDLTTTHPSNGRAFRYFDLTCSTVTPEDIKSLYIINPKGSFPQSN